MKKNVLFIYRGQVMKTEFLPEYEKYSEDNCVLLVEKDKTYHLLKLMINRLGLSVILMTHDDLLEDKIKMEFDVIVMNPPYKGGLHIDIFNKSFELLKDGGKMTCIHPSTPFVNRKNTKRQKKEIQIKKIISDYKSKLILIDGNLIFDAGFFTPLSITEVTKVKEKNIKVIYQHLDPNNNKTSIYNSIDDIYIHGNDLVLSIRDKIFKNFNISIADRLSRNGHRDYFYLKINTISGHPPKKGQNKVNPDFYCMIYKENENNLNQLISQNFETGDKNYIGLPNLQSAINCGKYLMTYFARFCVSFYKMNVQLSRGELHSVPFLDFNDEWTDETLYEYFGLTEEEINFINNYIGNWYERDFV
jgi:hypothetical protein